MPTVQVATVTPGLPMWLLDPLLTGMESSLHEAGAVRVWLSNGASGLVVLAELPADPTLTPVALP